MKRTISLLTVLAFVLALSGSVYAQNSITASADVVASVSVEGTPLNLSFATVSQDLSANTPTVNPTDGTASDIENGTPQVGRLVLSGTADASISITYSKNDLTDGNSNSITFNPDVVGKSGDGSSASHADDYTSGGTAVTLTTGANDDGGSNIVFDGSGFFTIWVGGELSGTASQPSGRYTGNQTFTVTYL